MIGIVGILAFLFVLGLSLVVTRIAAIALAHTGLSEETARFQARSAFTGTGFTTGEAENVVSHPVRRRIIMLLMVARSAGFVTIVISLILSFAELAGKTLRECQLLQEGATLLGITRKNGEYVGAPRPDAVITAGDTVLLYGRRAVLKRLAGRREDPSCPSCPTSRDSPAISMRPRCIGASSGPAATTSAW